MVLYEGLVWYRGKLDNGYLDLRFCIVEGNNWIDIFCSL